MIQHGPCLILADVFPPWRVAAWVFAVTSVLEFLQLWHPPVLEAIRATALGRLLIGTTFVWWDFPHYVMGCVLGVVLARWLGRRRVPGR